ncbi:MAG: signal peptidase II [Nocardioidaceae bacterium]
MQTTAGTSLTDHTDGASPAPRRKIVLWGAVAVVAYAADQASKWWATHHLTEGVPHQLIGSWLQLRLTHNAGAAFSVGTGYTALLSIVALTVIAVCLRMARRLGSTGWAIALGLLVGGALGNVTDRLLRPPGPFRGWVVDFLQLPHWPVFNLADSAITVAALMFIILSLRGVRLDGSLDRRAVADVASPAPRRELRPPAEGSGSAGEPVSGDSSGGVPRDRSDDAADEDGS